MKKKERTNRMDERKRMKYGCSLLALSFPFHLRTGESNFLHDPLLANFDPRKNTTWIMLHSIHSEKYSKSYIVQKKY